MLIYQGQIRADSPDAAAAVLLDRYPSATVTLRPAMEPGVYTYVATVKPDTPPFAQKPA